MEPTNNQVPAADGRTKTDYVEKVFKSFRTDLHSHDDYVSNFDAWEAMLESKTYDQVSKKTGSGLTDGRTTTIYDERAARVVGQLPTGVMRASGKKDAGCGMLLDIIRQKWLYVNANSQAPFLEKIRMWQFYASVYGFMPMFYDWSVSPSGYIGPDCWLWNPRNFVPQNGRSSLADMEYVHAIVYVGKSDLEGYLDQDKDAGWDEENLRLLIDRVEEKTRGSDPKRESFISQHRASQMKKGQIMLATRYEAGKDGRWVTFAPEFSDMLLRDIPNPHQNGEIPFVVKYAKPLFDNFYGLGDFQRAKPLQFASDGLDAFYFAGIKRGLYPPTIYNPALVNKNTLSNEPGAFWEETQTGAIREYSTNPTGLNTYSSAKTIMNGALLNQAGTTDTAVNADTALDPGFGKTPEALRKNGERESTRDSQDRFYLESRLEMLIDRMMGLFGTIGTETIPIDLFYDDFKDIIETSDEASIERLMEMVQVNTESAHLKIKPAIFKNLRTRFIIDSNSTALSTKQTQLNSLEKYMAFVNGNQNVVQQLPQQGMMFDFVQVSKIYGTLSDVPGLDKVVREMTPQEQEAYKQSQQPPAPDPKETVDYGTMYKYAPEDVKRSIEQLTGLEPSTMAMTTDQQLKSVDQAIKMQETANNAPDMDDMPDGPVLHNGQPINDPAIAKAYQKLGGMNSGGQ